MTKHLIAGASALAVAAMLAVAPAHASQFASFDPNGNATNFTWTNLGLGGSISGSGQVYFDYTNAGVNSILNATLTVTGSTAANPGVSEAYFDGTHYYQGVDTGTISLVYSGPTTTVGGITYTKDVTNLLTVNYTNAVIEGTTGGLLFSDNLIPTATTAFSSDLLTFPASGDEEFDINLTTSANAITSTGADTDAGSAATPASLSTFSAVASGAFTDTLAPSVPPPPSTPPLAVPEPASWAMMLIGFGLVGGVARRRSALTAA